MTDTIAMPDQTEEVVEGCELVDFMTRRARTYGLLARIFRVEVDGKFLEELRHLKFPTSTGNEHVDYGYRTMYNYLKGTWEDTPPTPSRASIPPRSACSCRTPATRYLPSTVPTC